MVERGAPAASGAQAIPPRLAYQPALDGLRAVAVVAVLLYHDNSVSFVHGGFLGVDVFFVLSGFLITTILLADRARRGRTVSLEFWVRRARRLLPAFLIMMLLVAAYVALAPDPVGRLNASSTGGAELRRAGLSALLYASNWQQVYWSDFLPTPVSHMWSLSIEEQWYVVWPFLLGGLAWLSRGRTKVLAAMIGALAIASATWMAVLYRSGVASRAFFGTDARAWELLAGALLSVLLIHGRGSRERSRSTKRAFEAAAVAGLVTIVWAYTAFRDGDASLYPTGRVALVAGAALVIAGILEGSGQIVRRILSWRPLVWIGLISYGLYLYHVPLFGWMSPERIHLDGTALLLVRTVVLFALATVSYVLVENPIRRGAPLPISGRIAVPISFAAVAIVFLASTTLARTTGTRFATSVTVAHYRELVATTPAGVKRVLVVGDETAVDLGLQVASPVDRDGIRGTVAGACGIAGGTSALVDDAPFGRCPPWEVVYREAVDAYRPDVVVLMTGTTEVFDREVDGTMMRVGSPKYARYLMSRLERVRTLVTAGGSRLVMLTVPCADPAASHGHGAGFGRVRGDASRVAWVNGVWRDFAARHPETVSVADLNDVLCPAGNAHARIGRFEFRPNGINLSPTGAGVTWGWLAPIARTAADHATTE